MSVKFVFTAIRKNIRAIPTEKVYKEVDRYTAQNMRFLMSTVRQYPSAVAGSRYLRTFRLFNAWRLRSTSTGNGIQWTITNSVQDRRSNVYYASRVHGTAGGRGQWALHKDHGWRNLYDELQKMGGRNKFAAGVQRIITREVKGGA
jgi:hypothetical protein